MAVLNKMKKLSITNIGCEELLVEFNSYKFCWIEETGAFRFWGNSKPFTFIHNKKELRKYFTDNKKRYSL